MQSRGGNADLQRGATGPPAGRVRYSANSVSLSYAPLEDRIRWLNHCTDGSRVAVWLTRRQLATLLPRLAGWLEKISPLCRQEHASVYRTDAARKDIARFEHEAAQQQVTAVREPALRHEIAAEFLLANLGVGTTGSGQLSLTLLGKDGQLQVRLQASPRHVHKIVGELLRISHDSGWHIPSPWQEPHSLPQPEKSLATQH